ncbi:hypothetical protein JTM35_34395, partial [Pseudomonas aeruginosa]|nr:hypothetical protein [Pseudomonas aeruginosa]
GRLGRRHRKALVGLTLVFGSIAPQTPDSYLSIPREISVVWVSFFSQFIDVFLAPNFYPNSRRGNLTLPIRERSGLGSETG